MEMILKYLVIVICIANVYSFKRDLKLDTLTSLSRLNQRYVNNITQNDFSSSTENDDDYIDDDETTSTTTVKPTLDEEHFDDTFEDETTTKSNDANYDDETEYEEADNNEETEDTNVDPYNCPSQCKCKFNKIETKPLKEEDNEYEDDETDTTSETRSKRSLEYNENNEEQDVQTDKYKIDVDCSGASINSIRNLFDEEFPLDQIISFNLSFNKFKTMKLEDGFEDLTNLEQIDLSSNSQLKSLSPRNFLRKFRHLKKLYLNNLPQINCINQFISIDCKWFKTLVYLNKRNITVEIEQPLRCDSNQLSSAHSIVSRCFGGGGHIVKKTNGLFHIDNIQFELKVEPELDQILIDGDTLELGCRFKKFTNLKLKKTSDLSNNRIFLETHLKWFLLNKNDEIVEIDSSKLSMKPPFVNVFETNHKVKNELIVESKLLVKGVKSVLNSGKYYCTTFNQFSSGLSNLNTSTIEISILDKNNNNEIGEISKKQKPKNVIFCQEFVTNTYKGSYKWPRTTSSTKSKQKCLSNPNKEASFTCDSNGSWFNAPNIEECHFDSNLTRYLQTLTKLEQKNTIKLNSNISLDELIHKLVSFQLGDINPNDIIYIQRFLIANFNNSKHINSSKSPTWRRQFIWLNDLLSKLAVLNQSKTFDELTFSSYFQQCLIPVLIEKITNLPNETNVTDLVLSSNYLTSVFVSSKMIQNKTLDNKQLVCYLDKYALSQQIYFRCFLNNDTNQQQKAYSTKIELDLNLTNYYLNSSTNQAIFMLFENYNMFPNQFKTNRSFIELYKSNKLISYENLTEDDDRANEISAQIFGLATQTLLNNLTFNISLEIKMPMKFYRLLTKIESKLIDKQRELYWMKLNRTNGSVPLDFEDNKQFKIYQVDKNPFDQIFTSNVIEYTVLNQVENQNYTTNELDDLDLNNSIKIQKLRNNLINKWFSTNNYELVYLNLTDWIGINCSLLSIEQLFKLETDFTKPFIKRSDNNYRIFGNINCRIESFNSTDKLRIQFITLKNVFNKRQIDPACNDSFKLVVNMIDQYTTVFNLNEMSLISSIYSLFHSNYRYFFNKIIYFSSITSCVLLALTIISYLISRKQILIPRSFYHTFVNIWICVLMLTLTYLFGINQINIAQICLPTALLLHYLTLCTSAWYTLYFYSLFAKLNTLKKRNYNLIFNLMKDNLNENQKSMAYKSLTKKKDDAYDDEEEEEYIKKPVIHLYMFGWGLPLLLCSIIVSIAKRDYLTVPYSSCFTNDSNILIGSVAVPILLMFIIKLVFIGLITFTLNRILKDLKKDTNDSDSRIKTESETITQSNELKDKLQMCQNWTQNREVSPIQEDEVPNELNRLNGQSRVSSVSNIYSERTSVMDTQHKPDIQLKFACVSVLIYLIGWSIGACLTLSPLFTRMYLKTQNNTLYEHFNSHELHTNDLFKKCFTYSLAIIMIIYSILQISFYMLSRDDIILFEKRQKNLYFAKEKQSILQSNLFQQCFNSKNKVRKMSESSTVSQNNNSDNVVTINDNIGNNWYFEPPVIALNNDQLDHAAVDITNENHRESICDVLFSAKKESPTRAIQSNKVNEMASILNNQSIMPTLASQEEISEIYLDTRLKYQSEDENHYSKLNKKSSHVRNPSVLSGSVAQNIQILNGSHFLEQNTSINNSRYSSKTMSKAVYKKPPYVFVDYTYEEKILKTTPTIIKNEPNNEMTKSLKKNNLGDLLMNSCSVNTGTAIDALPDMIESIKSISCETNQTLLSCLMLKNNVANSNGTDSATTSLSVSSSNTVSSLNFNNNLLNELNIYKDNLNDCAQIYTSASNRSSQVSSIIYHSNTLCNMPRKSNDSNLRNNILKSNKLDVNHETSV